jgi:hypothetical protein
MSIERAFRPLYYRLGRVERAAARLEEVFMSQYDDLSAAITGFASSLDTAKARIDDDVQELRDEVARLVADNANDLTDDQAAGLVSRIDDLKASVDAIDPVPEPEPEQPTEPTPGEPGEPTPA